MSYFMKLPQMGEELVKKPKNHDDNSPNLVETSDNHIYFYSEVDRDSILQFNKNVKAVAADLLYTASAMEIPCPEMKIHINSGGGSIFDAFSAVDYIRNCKVPTHSIVEGAAASAATIMSVSAQKRSINKNSFMLIHQLSAFSWGKYEELVDDHKNHTALMDSIKKIYLERTKIPEKVLKELLKRDLYLDAKQCLKYGLVDTILD